MGAALTIACVYKPGGGFSDEYVHRLRAGTQEFCRREHRFVCLTTQKLKGIECVPLVNHWQGWWNKIELFRRGLFDGPVAYFDLDTIFVDDITDMVVTPFEFVCGTNWKGHGSEINSATMMWDGRVDFSYIYDAYHPGLNERYEQDWRRWGDQGFIQDHLRVPFTSLNELFPGRVVSYKWHVKSSGQVPPAASIVCFHGKPRPHQINWALPNWLRDKQAARAA